MISFFGIFRFHMNVSNVVEWFRIFAK